MSRTVILIILFVVACVTNFCTRPERDLSEGGIIPLLTEEETEALMETAPVQELRAAMEKLRPLHEKLGPPRPGEWLAEYYERGQTFEEYIAIKPFPLKRMRRTIYIQPLGEFSDTQRRIVTLTADFMGRYFNLPVKFKEDLPLSVIPDEARRANPGSGHRQILSTYVLDKVLKPRLPEDAIAYIAFTSSDLYPEPSWNFVFGQASLINRVGVWSIYRFGDPDAGEEEFKLALLRTMKISTHETGHMFSLLHCIEYECNMCGSNSTPENDRQPLYLCPECMAKICWITSTDPAGRYKKLAEFCKTHGFKDEQAFYEKSANALLGKDE